MTKGPISLNEAVPVRNSANKYDVFDDPELYEKNGSAEKKGAVQPEPPIFPLK